MGSSRFTLLGFTEAKGFGTPIYVMLVSSLWMSFPLLSGCACVKIGYPKRKNIPKSCVLSVLSSFFQFELLCLRCMLHFQHRQTQQIRTGLGQNSPTKNAKNIRPSIPLEADLPQDPTRPQSFVPTEHRLYQIPTANGYAGWDP